MNSEVTLSHTFSRLDHLALSLQDGTRGVGVKRQAGDMCCLKLD